MGAANSKNIKYNPIAWSMWANVLGVFAALFMIIGGIISQNGFERSSLGAGVLGAGFFVGIFEWPRGKRKKGWTIPRAYQHKLQPLIVATGPIGRNYFFRAILWLMISVMCFFCFPCVVGGVTLALSALVYFVAAIIGEQWQPLDAPRERAKGPRVNEAPSKPPPRLIAAPTQNPPRAPGAPAVREAYVDSTPRARVTSAAPNKPVPVPTAAPTRPVPVPTKAPNRPVPVPGDAPNKPVPVPKPKPKERGSDKFKNYPWEAAKDPETNDTYYINNDTDETQWEKPKDWDEFVRVTGGTASDSTA